MSAPPDSPEPTEEAPPPSVLESLPSNKTRTKRPLLHPPIPTPTSTQQKVVYVSAKTPFISAVKRIAKLLDGPVAASGNGRKGRGKKRSAGGEVKKEHGEGVVLKATGRAIDRALQLGVHFQAKEGHRVVVKTGTVAVVDDVVDLPEDAPAWMKRRRREGKGGAKEGEQGGEGENEAGGEGEGGNEAGGKGEGETAMEVDDKDAQGDDTDDIEMIVRKTSKVEIWVTKD